MNTVIIGSGNVAEAIARAMAESQTRLLGIYARNSLRGREIAAMCGCRHFPYGATLPVADIYIMAISDSAISKVSAETAFPVDAIVAHTSGGTAIEALSDRIAHRAVLYPLQTFTKGRPVDFRHIPLFIEASDEPTTERLHTFAHTLSEAVYRADSQLRAQIHVAGVFANNFTNRMYGISREIISRAGLPYDILKPLIAETCAKAIEAENPAAVQTGPAIRGDIATQERHLDLLKGDETKTEIYKLISKEIWETSKKI